MYSLQEHVEWFEHVSELVPKQFVKGYDDDEDESSDDDDSSDESDSEESDSDSESNTEQTPKVSKVDIRKILFDPKFRDVKRVVVRRAIKQRVETLKKAEERQANETAQKNKINMNRVHKLPNSRNMNGKERDASESESGDSDSESDKKKKKTSNIKIHNRQV